MGIPETFGWLIGTLAAAGIAWMFTRRETRIAACVLLALVGAGALGYEQGYERSAADFRTHANKLHVEVACKPVLDVDVVKTYSDCINHVGEWRNAMPTGYEFGWMLIAGALVAMGACIFGAKELEKLFHQRGTGAALAADSGGQGGAVGGVPVKKQAE